MATTTKSLWWNQRGQIGCDDHMPYVGSDTFVWEGPECETCSAIERRSA